MGKDLGIAQYTEFAVAVLRQLPRDIPSGEAQYWIEKQDELKERLRGLLVADSATANPVPTRNDWPRLYQEILGSTPDFSGLAIPKDPGGYGWIIPVGKGLTANRVWAECKKLFPCYSYFGDDLDGTVPTNERTAEKASYIIRVRDRAEADEELANLSANQIKKQKLTTMTLTERLLLELWYFWKTGKHLDVQNITLCTGSRGSDGSVPDVFWLGGELNVNWRFPGNAYGILRARSAVS